MAYSLETSSVKTIVPGAEVSGFCDVVARQAIANLPTLSGGEGVQIVNEDGKNRIDLGLSAGSNISLVYDMETNTYRIDGQGGDVFPIVSSDDSQQYSKYIYELDGLASGIKSTYTNSSIAITATSSTEVSPNKIVLQTSSDNATYPNEVIITNDKVSKLWYADTYRSKQWDDIIKPTIEWNSATDFHAIGSGAELRVWYHEGDPSASYSWSGIKLNQKYNTVLSSLYINTTGVSSYSSSNSSPQRATWEQIIEAATGSKGHTYTGVAPIVVNNTTNQISADTWSFSAGEGLVFTDDNANKVTKLEVEGETLSAGPGINIFASGEYVVISSNGGNAFPITGTNGTTGFTANMDCSSMYLSTGAGPAGAIVNLDTRGVHFEAYPSVDVSASWFNLITQYNNTTCSSVKLTTADRENRFYTSALPNLNKITFIAPSYGPYETYSALIDDGSTTFVAEVDSGCCRTVVRNWNDDRHKDCWCGLNQETYFYIG